MVTRTQAAALWTDWSAMWNGDTELAHKLVSDECVVHFGRAAGDSEDPRGPAELAAFVEKFRSGYRSLTYSTEIGPAVDETEGLVSARWFADLDRGEGPQRKGGIDLLRVVDGVIVEVWSVTGERLLSLG